MVPFTKRIEKVDKKLIDKIVKLHIMSFQGFFLSTLHPGFLRQLYKSFVTHKKSELLVAFKGEDPVGFIAYSMDTTGAYRHMLHRYFFPFFWYSFLSFLKNPSIFIKMFSALGKPYMYVRDWNYIKIFSLGVCPDYRKNGIGSLLLDDVKRHMDAGTYDYITLETDANDNDDVNEFYLKNGFVLSSQFTTFEGRNMNKYHYRRQHEDPVS